MDQPDLAEELKQLTVLYVEDNEALRLLMQRLLAGRVGRLLLAEDGEQGLASYRENRPDIVISDIMMPVMDGMEMMAAIKAIDHTTPVILATAFDDAKYLLQALALDADGYLVKPIKLETLLQALEARVAGYLQDRELARYRVAAEEERQLIAELMTRMMRPEKLDDPRLHYWLRAAESVGGDLLAFSRSRNDRCYLMLADSAGHGLPAALNLLPVNYIFHRMAGKGLPLALIVEEMNRAIREHSPADRYVALLLACVDPHNRVVEIWNGGLPPALLLDAGTGEVLHAFASTHAPLGVLGGTFQTRTEICQWHRPCQLQVHSDGLNEVVDGADEDPGFERLMRSAQGPVARFDAIRATIAAHLGDRPASDDITLALLDCAAPSGQVSAT